MPASLVFGDGVVQLLMGGDVIGSWLSEEIDIHPVDSAFELRAEGEALGFTPLQMKSFEAFLAGDPDHELEEVEESIFSTPSDLTAEWSAPDVESPLEAVEADAPESSTDAIETDAFAPDADTFAAVDSSAFSENGDLDTGSPETIADSIPDPVAPPPPADSSDYPESHYPESDYPESHSLETSPGLAETVTDESPGLAETLTEISTVASVPPDRSETTDTTVDKGDTTPSTDAVDHSQDVVTDTQPDTQDSLAPAKKPRISLLSRMARPTEPEPETEEPSTGPLPAPVPSGTDAAAEDDTPAPIDDAENLRQWRLVIAVGAGALVVLVALVWGVASLFGGEGEESTDEAVTVTTVETATEAPPAAGNPVTPPPAPEAPEPPPEEPVFVEDWNQLAGQYAAHFRLDAQPLPISTTLSPTVHLIYDDSGTLRLDMVPTGTGSDRDILIAMGLAVAWADPTLEPDARRDLLGALGVDVDNPSLAEIGGELSRNGVTYMADVGENQIRFEITSAG